VKEAELRRLITCGLIENYSAHLRNHPQSMLSRIFGVYKVKVRSMHAISIIIMENIVGEHNDEL
jgi:hypothetical protein